MRTRTLIAALAITCLSSAPAGAEEDAPVLAWSQDRDAVWLVDSSDAGMESDFYSFSRLIRTTGNTGPAILLNCQANSRGTSTLNVAFQLDPANRYEDDPALKPRVLNLSGKVTIGTERFPLKFLYHPDSSKIVPFDKTLAKHMFNAVVEGSGVTLKIKGKTHELEMPPKDPVFVAFAKICPITNGGKFDMSIFDDKEALEANRPKSPYSH